MLTKVQIVKAIIFTVVMYRCESWTSRKKGWMPKNWCFESEVLESPLDCKEIKPVNPKGNQPWIFTGKTVTEAEAPILWQPETELTHWKDPDAGKDWRQKEKGVSEDKIDSITILNGLWFEETLRGEDRGSWYIVVLEVAKNQTWVREWTTTKTVLTISFLRAPKSPIYLCLCLSEWVFHCHWWHIFEPTDHTIIIEPSLIEAIF